MQLAVDYFDAKKTFPHHMNRAMRKQLYSLYVPGVNTWPIVSYTYSCTYTSL